MNLVPSILLLYGLLHLGLFIYSLQKVRNSKEAITFINPWGFPFGAFVFEDLFILSIFNFFISIFALLMRDVRIGLLGYCVFGVIRWSGETIYYFLQQFHVPKHYPHEITGHLRMLKYFLGDISYQKSLILIQVITQVLVMFFAFFLILLLKYWDMIPGGFS
jgi:hypothetical protein